MHKEFHISQSRSVTTYERCGKRERRHQRPVDTSLRLTSLDFIATICGLPLTLAALLLIGGNLMADSYRAHYSIKGSGRDIIVQAESSAEARRTVMEMVPGALVTGVHRVKLRKALRKLERWFWIHFVRIDNGTDLCFWLARDACEFSESRPVFPSTNNLESFHYLIYTHDTQALALGRRPSQTLCRSRMLPEI